MFNINFLAIVSSLLDLMLNISWGSLFVFENVIWLGSTKFLTFFQLFYHLNYLHRFNGRGLIYHLVNGRTSTKSQSTLYKVVYVYSYCFQLIFINNLNWYQNFLIVWHISGTVLLILKSSCDKKLWI